MTDKSFTCFYFYSHPLAQKLEVFLLYTACISTVLQGTCLRETFYASLSELGCIMFYVYLDNECFAQQGRRRH